MHPPITSSSSRLSSPRLRLVTAVLVLSVLLASLDQTVFGTALPSIAGDLGAAASMHWVTTAYVLASTVVMPIYGKLGDLHGRKLYFVAAVLLFMLGSVLGGLALDITSLNIARAVQGLGGGGLILLSQTIIADVVPSASRSRYLGMLGAIFALASLLGPLLGGWLTEGPGWRWAFWMNIPTGLAVLVTATLYLPGGTKGSNNQRFDWLGTVLVSTGIISLLLAISLGGHAWAWDSAEIAGLFSVAAIAITAFVVVEHRHPAPILPMSLFGERNSALALGTNLALGAVMFGSLAYLPTAFQMVYRLSATAAGLMLLPLMAGIVVGSISAGALTPKLASPKWLPVVGMAIAAAALVPLAALSPQTPLWSSVVTLCLLGVGIGLSMQTVLLIAQSSRPAAELGVTTGASGYLQKIGGTAGAGFIGAFFADRLSWNLGALADSSLSKMDRGSVGPETLAGLPAKAQFEVAEAYSSALMPLYATFIPIAFLAAACMFFIQEKTLRISEPAVQSEAK